jgi:hypothetical protein
MIYLGTVGERKTKQEEKEKETPTYKEGRKIKDKSKQGRKKVRAQQERTEARKK